MNWSHKVTIQTSNPARLLPLVGEEIERKAAEGCALLSTAIEGSTALLLFKRAA